MIDIIFALPFHLCWPLKICVCLPRKYGRFMLLIDNNLLLPGAKLHILINIYRWFLGKRETVNAWKKTDFDGFREKDE
jgi:hypothetical protein